MTLFEQILNNNRVHVVTTGNNIGDVCEGDSDGDGSADIEDQCMYNPSRSITDFTSYTSIKLDPSLSSATAANWEIKHSGAEIRQLALTEMPLMLIGKYACVFLVLNAGLLC